MLLSQNHWEDNFLQEKSKLCGILYNVCFYICKVRPWGLPGKWRSCEFHIRFLVEAVSANWWKGLIKIKITHTFVAIPSSSLGWWVTRLIKKKVYEELELGKSVFSGEVSFRSCFWWFLLLMSCSATPPRWRHGPPKRRKQIRRVDHEVGRRGGRVTAPENGGCDARCDGHPISRCSWSKMGSPEPAGRGWSWCCCGSEGQLV
jgi:hypothetical protein